jgi:hypothetical protein
MQNYTNDIDAANALSESYAKLTAEIARVIVGQEEVVRLVLTGIFCHGHSLLVGSDYFKCTRPSIQANSVYARPDALGYRRR